MFEKFVEECSENPNQAEILFFNESILEKINRSSTQFSKKKTPFLDDKRYIYFVEKATFTLLAKLSPTLTPLRLHPP